MFFSSPRRGEGLVVVKTVGLIIKVFQLPLPPLTPPKERKKLGIFFI